jgi:hypothetical protein
LPREYRLLYVGINVRFSCRVLLTTYLTDMEKILLEKLTDPQIPKIFPEISAKP